MSRDFHFPFRFYSGHRKEGFETAVKVMDGLKGRLPIWENEGGEWGKNKEWKGGKT